LDLKKKIVTIIFNNKKILIAGIIFIFTKLNVLEESPVNKIPKKKTKGIEKSNPVSSRICQICRKMTMPGLESFFIVIFF
jgi:hypothetical protein